MREWLGATSIARWLAEAGVWLDVLLLGAVAVCVVVLART